jgi:hypothetical protein
VAGEVNLLEEPQPKSDLTFGPFRIRSLHLKKAAS